MARFANKAAKTTLSAGLAGTGAETTLTVGSTEGWPVPAAGEVAKGVIAPGSSNKTIFSYTGKTATTFTGVVQGLEGTVAFNHASGVAVEFQVTADHFEQNAQKNLPNIFTEDQAIEVDNSLLFGPGGAIMGDGGGALIWTFNARFSSPNWVRRVADNDASRVYLANNGDMVFETATDANSTVGSTITWGEKFRITKAGDVLFGNTAALDRSFILGDRVSLMGSDQAYWQYNAKWNAGSSQYERMVADADAARLFMTGSGDLVYQTNSDANTAAGSAITWSEKFRITKGGRVSPGADNDQDLGTSSLRWSSGHFNLLHAAQLTRSGDTSRWVWWGTGSPEGVYSAAPGALYLRTNPSVEGEGLYVKITGTGNTGWYRVGDVVWEQG